MCYNVESTGLVFLAPFYLYSNMYCIVYRLLYSAFHGMSQTEAPSVHFSYRKKVRLKTRERQEKGSRENRRVKRRRKVIPERRTNRWKGRGLQSKPSVPSLILVLPFRLLHFV